MPRLSQRPDPAFLIPLVVFLLVLRMPGGSGLLGLVGLILILWRGIRPVRVDGLLAAYAVCILASGAAAYLADDYNVTSYVWPAIGYALFSAAVLWTGDLRRNIAGLTTGLLAGFTLALTMAWLEILSGVRLLTIGRQGNKGLEESLTQGRFRTGAFYTNYNDLSVALAILAILVIASLLFAPRARSTIQVTRVAVAGGAAALVLLMGSRGSLAALMLAVGVLVVLAARAAHPRTWTNRRLGLLALAVSLIGVVAWRSPYVQDNSTAIRERILASALQMLDLQPTSWVIGMSSEMRYLHTGESLYPGELMNPHNLVLEFLLSYGLVGLLAAGVCWGVLVVTGVTVSHPRHWTLPGYTAACLAIPVIGIVPSTILTYGFVQLLVLGLAAAISAERRSGSAGSAPRPIAQGGHHHEARGTTGDSGENVGLDGRAGHA